VIYRDGQGETTAGRHIFDRDGQITQVWVTIAD
jgi:hypothetical protein